MCGLLFNKNSSNFHLMRLFVSMSLLVFVSLAPPKGNNEKPNSFFFHMNFCFKIVLNKCIKLTLFLCWARFMERQTFNLFEVDANCVAFVSKFFFFFLSSIHYWLERTNSIRFFFFVFVIVYSVDTRWCPGTKRERNIFLYWNSVSIIYWLYRSVNLLHWQNFSLINCLFFRTAVSVKNGKLVQNMPNSFHSFAQLTLKFGFSFRI